MARIVKEPDERRAEILATAQRLFMTNGYHATSIQQIIDAIGIAKGTFYHYFRSKSDLVDAMAEQVEQQALVIMTPILADDTLGAAARLERMFSNLGHWKTDNRELLTQLITALRDPQNAPLLMKMNRHNLEVFAPLMGQILAQGVEEGVFTVRDPQVAARLVFSMFQALSDPLGDLLLDPPATGAFEQAEALVAATEEAVCRVLGVEVGSLTLMDLSLFRRWFP